MSGFSDLSRLERSGVSSRTSHELIRTTSEGILTQVQSDPNRALDTMSEAVMSVYQQGMQEGMTRGRLLEARQGVAGSQELLVQVVGQNAEMRVTLTLTREDVQRLRLDMGDLSRDLGIEIGHRESFFHRVQALEQNHLQLAKEVGERKGENGVVIQSLTQVQSQYGEIKADHGALTERLRALEETTVVGQIMKVSVLAFKNFCKPVISSDFRWIAIYLAFAMLSHKLAVAKGGLAKHSIGAPSRLAIPALVVILAMKIAELRKASINVDKVKIVVQESFTWISLLSVALAGAMYVSKKTKKPVITALAVKSY